MRAGRSDHQQSGLNHPIDSGDLCAGIVFFYPMRTPVEESSPMAGTLPEIPVNFRLAREPFQHVKKSKGALCLESLAEYRRGIFAPATNLRSWRKKIMPHMMYRPGVSAVLKVRQSRTEFCRAHVPSGFDGHDAIPRAERQGDGNPFVYQPQDWAHPGNLVKTGCAGETARIHPAAQHKPVIFRGTA